MESECDGSGEEKRKIGILSPDSADSDQQVFVYDKIYIYTFLSIIVYIPTCILSWGFIFFETPPVNIKVASMILIPVFLLIQTLVLYYSSIVAFPENRSKYRRILVISLALIIPVINLIFLALSYLCMANSLLKKAGLLTTAIVAAKSVFFVLFPIASVFYGYFDRGVFLSIFIIPVACLIVSKNFRMLFIALISFLSLVMNISLSILSVDFRYIESMQVLYSLSICFLLLEYRDRIYSIVKKEI